jgi:nucleoid-associated protein YgaU
MRKLLLALAIALVTAGTSPAVAESYVLYPPDFTFYPESLINAYMKAKAEHARLLKELEKCKEELALLRAKRNELEERYGKLSQEVAMLKKQIAEVEALMRRLSELERLASKKVDECEEMLKRWQALPKNYTVKRGDTLWGIASKDFIYGDPWQWPLIYKANRDKVKNPHLIFPSQRLRIPRDITCDDIINARRQALKTPPPPGVKPIKVGPVKAEEVPETATDYFLCTKCRR